MQGRQIVGKTLGNKTIYDEMDIHSYDASGHVVCMCGLGWWSQQKLSNEETHEEAETCLPHDFISFSWYPYWCSGNIAQHNSHRGILSGCRLCEGHTESLLVGSGMSIELFPLENEKPC